MSHGLQGSQLCELNRSGTCHRSLERLNRVIFYLKKKVSSKTYFLHCAAYTYYKTIPSTKYASTGVETAVDVDL